MIHRELTRRHDDKSAAVLAKYESKKVSYKPLTYPALHLTRHIHNEASIHDYSTHVKNNNIAIHIQRFLANARIAEADHCGRGITWYELYILYRIRGYPKPLQDPDTKARSKATACKQIRNLTKQFRSTICRTLIDSDSHLFKPYRLQKDGLLGVGILGNHAAVRCNIHVTDEEQKAIAEALVSLSRSINKKNCNEFLQELNSIIPKELKLNGKASWDSTLVCIQHENVEISPNDRTWSVTIASGAKDGKPTYFRCPKCTNVESSTCSNFQTDDLDKKQNCNACGKSTSVSNWKCDCNKHWHNCAYHRASCTDSASRKNKSNPSRPNASSDSLGQKDKRGRTLAQMTFEQLLSEDRNRAKRKRDESDELGDVPTIILGKRRIKTIKVASLPPSLKRRFLHPGGE